jgi:hypothetical protein
LGLEEDSFELMQKSQCLPSVHVLSINLESDEEDNIDKALVWSKADFDKAVEKTKHAL